MKSLRPDIPHILIYIDATKMFEFMELLYSNISKENCDDLGGGEWEPTFSSQKRQSLMSKTFIIILFC